MTNEEAIKRVEGLKKRCERMALRGNLEEWRKDAEACDIAISALQSVGKDHLTHIDRDAWKPCADCKSCVSCEYSMVPYGEKPCTVCRRENRFKPRKFCNSCGKPLTEEAWAELEKRLREVTNG